MGNEAVVVLQRQTVSRRPLCACQLLAPVGATLQFPARSAPSHHKVAAVVVGSCSMERARFNTNCCRKQIFSTSIAFGRIHTCMHPVLLLLSRAQPAYMLDRCWSDCRVQDAQFDVITIKPVHMQ